MPSYKFTYFDFRGRGETTRMLFAMGDQKYDDVRVVEETEWPDIKPKTPFGFLPMMEVDGVIFCQSRTIDRFLATRFGLYGENEMEQTRVNMVVDCTEDMFRPAIDIFYADKDKKGKLIETYVKDKAPVFLENLNKMVNADGYFVGKKLSWADINFHNLTSSTIGSGVDISAELNKYPKLLGISEKVVSNPKIADWITKRPKTDY